MSDVTLVLGPIIFQGFELPDRINVGGQQRLAVHRMTNGQRVVDCLGRDDSDLTFHGIFSGPHATKRARTLDVLRIAGEPLPLTWDTFFYTVVIRRFEAEYQHHSWIPYRITCTVVQDDALDLTISAVSLVSSLLGDVNAAAESSSDLQLDFTGIQVSLTATGAAVRGTAAYRVAQSEMLNMQSIINRQVGVAQDSFQVSSTTIDASTDGTISNYMAATGAVQMLGILPLTSAYLSRAVKNLSNAST